MQITVPFEIIRWDDEAHDQDGPRPTLGVEVPGQG
jgi:hypothetical protein